MPFCLPISTRHENFINLRVWWNKSVCIQRSIDSPPGFFHRLNIDSGLTAQTHCQYLQTTKIIDPRLMYINLLLPQINSQHIIGLISWRSNLFTSKYHTLKSSRWLTFIWLLLSTILWYQIGIFDYMNWKILHFRLSVFRQNSNIKQQFKFFLCVKISIPFREQNFCLYKTEQKKIKPG